MKRSWLVVACPNLPEENLSKTRKHFGQDNRRPGRDSNPAPHEYKSGALPLDQPIQFPLTKIKLPEFEAGTSAVTICKTLPCACRPEVNTYKALYLHVSVTEARGVGHEMSPTAQTLGLWVRIPLEVWMYVCVLASVALYR
jgi:hypothetical protein